MPLITTKSAEEIKGDSVRKTKKTPAKKPSEQIQNIAPNPTEITPTIDDRPKQDNQIDSRHIWVLLDDFIEKIPADQKTSTAAFATIEPPPYEHEADDAVGVAPTETQQANTWANDLGLDTIPEDIAIRAELVDLIHDARFNDLLDLIEQTDENPEIRSQARAYKEQLAAGS